jgi:heterodisulfide reductase subunit C
MALLDNILFGLLLIAGVGFFARNMGKVRRNISIGRAIDRTDQSGKRWKNMIRIALGQSKMGVRPVAGFLHLIVYVGFIIVNIEVLEIVIDGLFGTHRVFLEMGSVYFILIGAFEILAVLVLIAVVVFWLRRMVLRIPRFWNKEMMGFPKNDALNILYFEMILMSLFLIMNGADVDFQNLNSGNPISQFIASWLGALDLSLLHKIERISWWLHIAGIFLFLNYLYYSKHLHILLAFPNTYYAKLDNMGSMNNLEAVTKEVKLMLDPKADPYAATEEEGDPETFGAKDVFDLNRVQLLNAYTCTECGRCTSVCPASTTGKELSPRAILMKTRDRLEKVGKNIDKNGSFVDDGQQLLNDYIKPEELWACTSCNACVEACPVNIDPLSIIMDMRRYLVMEESSGPNEINIMMTNIENNGAPWPYNQMDRLNWKNE